MYRIFACLLSLLLMMAGVHEATAGELPVKDQPGPAVAQSALNNPLVIIYTESTCPHCAEAKEYFNRNNIPYVNREVDTDSQHMDDLMTIYDTMDVSDDKRGVPLIIIGDSKLQGFSKEKVQEALKKVTVK